MSNYYLFVFKGAGRVLKAAVALLRIGQYGKHPSSVRALFWETHYPWDVEVVHAFRFLPFWRE